MAGAIDLRRALLGLLIAVMSFAAHAGLFNEHKYIGDIAFKRFLAAHPEVVDILERQLHFPRYGADPPALSIPFKKNSFVRDYYQGMLALSDGTAAYSYGDFCGLAGDHAVDHAQLVSALFQMRCGADPAEGGLFPGLVNDVLEALTSHYEGIEEYEDEGSYFSLDYALLAQEDQSHFQVPGLSRAEMLAVLDTGVVRLVQHFMSTPADQADPGLRTRFNCSLFRMNNTSKYALLHLVAQQYMLYAATNKEAQAHTAFRCNLLYGFAMNAFADHFLHDAFASGHMVTDRSGDGLDNKGVHDYYNRVGLGVSDATGSAWTTFGDDHYSDEEFERAIQANLRSLEELWHTYQHYAIAPEDAILWEHLLASSDASGWPTLILDKCNAFELAPTPLSPAQYATIELKQGSKNGAFYQLDYRSTFTDPFNDHLFHAGIGLGYNLIKPDPCTPHRPCKDRIESVLWIGLGLQYGFAHLNNTDTHRAYVTVSATLFDRLAVDQGLGHAFFPGGGSAGYTAIGIEFKWLSDRLAPSLKAMVDYERGRTPVYGIVLGLRRY